MRYATLDLIACPMCRGFPLKLYVFEEKTLATVNVSEKPFCTIFCGFLGRHVGEINIDAINCSLCLSRDVIYGIISCERCWRWYPIVGGVALMYPDDIRLHTRIRVVEELFMRKYRDIFPNHITDKDPLKLFRRVQHATH